MHNLKIIICDEIISIFLILKMSCFFRVQDVPGVYHITKNQDAS